MNEQWQAFLTQQSAHIENGLAVDFGDDDSNTESNIASDKNIIMDLSQFDVLAISGEDASAFLHSQFCSDVAALAQNEVQTSAWCNIKGRVIASFLLYRASDCYYLLLEKEITEKLQKRLQMFVLRSRVSIVRKSDQMQCIGIRGEIVHKDLQQYRTNTDESGIEVLGLRDAIPRSILLCTSVQARPLWLALAKNALAIGSKYWSLLDIRAGIAWIGGSGSEEFLPQSLNLDLTGGLSFNKGCYPGQEIVARMHFRGKLKQRLFLLQASIDEAPAVTSKLHVADRSQYIGMVVNSFLQQNNRCLILATVDLDSINDGDIHLHAVDGPTAEVLSLPYDPAS
jgi:tRNA-modifying protein YgfZ